MYLFYFQPAFVNNPILGAIILAAIFLYQWQVGNFSNSKAALQLFNIVLSNLKMAGNLIQFRTSTSINNISFNF